MATRPPHASGIPRNELSDFLPSQRAVRAFENLFQDVQEINDSDLTGTSDEASAALSIAGSAESRTTHIEKQSLQVMVWLGL